MSRQSTPRRGYKESGAYVIGIVGFRNQDLVFWDDKFGAVCDELIICTDDGSAGIKVLEVQRVRRENRVQPRAGPARRSRGLALDHARSSGLR